MDVSHFILCLAIGDLFSKDDITIQAMHRLFIEINFRQKSASNLLDFVPPPLETQTQTKASAS